MEKKAWQIGDLVLIYRGAEGNGSSKAVEKRNFQEIEKSSWQTLQSVLEYQSSLRSRETDETEENFEGRTALYLEN